MVYLLLSIICTSIIFLIFRYIGGQQINTFHTIVSNYFFCFLTSLFFLPGDLYFELRTAGNQFYLIGFLIGILFIIIFFFIARTTQIFGVGAGTITSRMSLVIPAIFSIMAYHEPVNVVKVIGIFAALLAIYFTIYKRNGKLEKGFLHKNIRTFFFPFMAFAGTGTLDVLFKISQVDFLKNTSITAYLSLFFFIALILGLFALATQFLVQRTTLSSKSVKWGFFLGIANYFALYFFLLALNTTKLHGSVLFPINSVGIVAISTFASILIFHEKLNNLKKIGFGLSIVSILLMYLSQ